MHEASMHDDNCFITLTYDEDHLPWDGSLNKKHFQDFMKRLRWHNSGKSIRYFQCGEYGENFQRPHYHALLFNHDFQDKTLWTETDGIRTYVSEDLGRHWPWGFSTVGSLTWESAAYCARYSIKKRTGDDAEEHYWRILATDLEIQLEPEYATMSLKPAIGKTWFEEYRDDCFPSDYITEKGRKLRIPKYYDKLLADHNKQEAEAIKRHRKQRARERASDCTPTRLAQREICAKARLTSLKRNLEA